MAEAHLAARYNRPGHEVIDHYVYAICSDGDLMEGVAAEAASLAGHLKLGKLIYFWDDNKITIEGSTELAFTEDVAKRFEGYGWHTLTVEDGNDLEAIDAAIRAAQADPRPSMITVKTIIGYGSPNKAGSEKAHGEPLGEEEIKLTKKALGWPSQETFFVPDEALAHMRDAGVRGAARAGRLEPADGDAFARRTRTRRRSWSRRSRARCRTGGTRTCPRGARTTSRSPRAPRPARR